MFNIFFAYQNIVLGGCELLIEKLTRYYSKNGNHVGILCQECNDEMYIKYQDAGAKILKGIDWKSPSDQLPDLKNAYIITFLIKDFLRFNTLSSRNRILVYAVHFNALIFNNPIKKIIARPISGDRHC